MNKTEDKKAITPPPFESYNDFKSHLKAIPSETQTEWFDQLQEKLHQTPERRVIAFKALAEMAIGTSPFTRLRPIKKDLERVFYESDTPQIYTDDIAETRVNLQKLFINCSGNKDLKEFYSELHHLVGLLPVFQSVEAFELFEQRLSIYEDVFIRHMLRSRRSKKGTKTPVIGPVKISQILLASIPGSSPCSKKFEEFLTVIEYLRDIWEAKVEAADELMTKNDKLNGTIKEKEGDIEELNAEISELKESISMQNAEIRVLQDRQSKDQELLASQQHLIKHESDNAVRDSYTRLRRRMKSHLDNIRLFTDRDAPSRTGILDELEDIERFMQNYENEL